MSADNLAYGTDVKVSMNNDTTTEIKSPDEEVDHPLQAISTSTNSRLEFVRNTTGILSEYPNFWTCDRTFRTIWELVHNTTNPPSNLYVVKRNFIHQLMDVALLMANVSQLKALIELGSKDKYYYLLLVTIVMSISLQVIFTICMLIIWSIETGAVDNVPEILTEIPDKGVVLKDNKVANALDKFGNVLVLCIIVANVFIVGFGVEPHGPVNSGVNKTSS